jgi:hypothetical protein
MVSIGLSRGRDAVVAILGGYSKTFARRAPPLPRSSRARRATQALRKNGCAPRAPFVRQLDRLLPVRGHRAGAVSHRRRARRAQAGAAECPPADAPPPQRRRTAVSGSDGRRALSRLRSAAVRLPHFFLLARGLPPGGAAGGNPANITRNRRPVRSVRPRRSRAAPAHEGAFTPLTEASAPRCTCPMGEAEV